MSTDHGSQNTFSVFFKTLFSLYIYIYISANVVAIIFRFSSNLIKNIPLSNSLEKFVCRKNSLVFNPPPHPPFRFPNMKVLWPQRVHRNLDFLAYLVLQTNLFFGSIQLSNGDFTFALLDITVWIKLKHKSLIN